MSKHVEKYDSITFCGYVGDEPMVHRDAWHESPTALANATCVQCLQTIYTLGGWAQNALSKIKRRDGVPQGASWNPPPPGKR